MGDVHCVFRGFISLSIGYHDILRVSSLKNDILNDSVNATKTRMVFVRKDIYFREYACKGVHYIGKTARKIDDLFVNKPYKNGNA